MDRKSSLPPIRLIKEDYPQRRWLKKHGKENYLTFSDPMLFKLRKYFNSLDEDGSGSIGFKELEDSLILFGLCKNRKEVGEIFKKIDLDGSGEIDFNEFLQVFRSVNSIHSHFKSQLEDFTTTLLGIQGKIDATLGFQIGMAHYRRKHILKAILPNSKQDKAKGTQILKRWQDQVKDSPDLSQILSQYTIQD